jgi:tRNA U34 5-carboxymethylaminomethyl modifying GTPase MnmE/TrmE
LKAIAHNARNDLLNTFGDLQKEFDQSLAQAKQQEQEFNQQCLDFQKKVTSHLTRAKTKFADNNPLAKPIEGFINLIEDTNEQWTKRIAQQDKGVKFREGFNDSLLVFVFGKVKSGKSSLGNYMAWGNTDPTSEKASHAESSTTYLSFP